MRETEPGRPTRRADRPPVHPARVQFFHDGRSPDSRVVMPVAPSQASGPVVSRDALAAHSCGGSHGFSPYSLLGRHRMPATIGYSVPEQPSRRKPNIQMCTIRRIPGPRKTLLKVRRENWAGERRKRLIQTNTKDRCPDARTAVNTSALSLPDWLAQGRPTRPDRPA